jgi:hypothetical protein
MNGLWMWLKFAWHNCLRNRRRSLVTASIAMLGTAAILLAGGFALFTYESLAQAAARDTGHLVLGTPAHFSADEDMPLQHGLDDVAALRSVLLADPAVRAVLPRVVFSGLISNGDKTAVMMAQGVEPDAEFAVKGPFLTVQSGTLLAGDAAQPQVLLGADLARSLKATPGSSLTLLASTTEGAMNAMDVVVAGTFSTGVPDVDKRAVYTSVPVAQQLLATQRVSSLGVFLDRMESTAAARERLAQQFAPLQVQTWEQQAFFLPLGARSVQPHLRGAGCGHCGDRGLCRHQRHGHGRDRAHARDRHPACPGHAARTAAAQPGGWRACCWAVRARWARCVAGAGGVGAAVCVSGGHAAAAGAQRGLPAEHQHPPHAVPADHGGPWCC